MENCPVVRIRPTTRRGWLLVAAILGVAFVARVAVVFLTRHSYHPLNDAASFDIIANSIAHGHGYGKTLVVPAAGPSSYRDPMYPAVLAVAYAIFGHSWSVGRVEQAVIGTMFVALVGVVAAQLWSRREGAVAMAIAAVYPTVMLFGYGLQLEPLLITLDMGALAAALEHRRNPRGPRGLLWPIVSGLLLGFALLTREYAAAIAVPVIWILLTAGHSSWREALRSRRALLAPAVFLGVMVVTLVPWTIRNETTLHSFVPTSTSAGYTLAGTYNTTSMHNKQWPALWVPPYFDPTDAHILLQRPQPTELWTDNIMRSTAITFIEHHPTYLFTVAYWNTVRLFDLDGTKAALFDAPFLPFPHGLTVASVYASYLLELIAIAALFLRRTWTAPKVIWIAPILAFLGIILLSGFIRYRASIEPFTILLASVAVTAFATRIGVLAPE
jgi:hypothetical protein